jgi:hypothetical protein
MRQRGKLFESNVALNVRHEKKMSVFDKNLKNMREIKADYAIKR